MRTFLIFPLLLLLIQGCTSVPKKADPLDSKNWIQFSHVVEVVDSLTEEISYERQNWGASFQNNEILIAILEDEMVKYWTEGKVVWIEKLRYPDVKSLFPLSGRVLERLEKEKGIPIHKRWRYRD